MLPRRLKLVGCDPSLRNWGLARGFYDTLTGDLEIETLSSIHPVLPTGKQVRQNSLDLESSRQLYRDTVAFVQDAHAMFIEVPVGSQSARAMASYGICVGVLGALRAGGTPFFEVTATEVKLAGHGTKTATKLEMINWAVKKHPEANWPTYVHNGVKNISEAKAEHMADAVAAIHAGINSNPFKQLLQIAA
jgi:hypothetical protein